MAAWATAALLLLLPLVAMQVSDEVRWDLADFLLFGGLLISAGITYEIAAMTSADAAYRAGVAVALGTAFVLIWINLAVGIIGSEDNPANLMYGAVLVVGLVGAIMARFRPRGMARALVAIALAQALVALITLAADLGGLAGPLLEIIGVNAMFIALWLLSAWLFQRVGTQE